MAEITLEELKQSVAFKRIPILTLDERWYHLVPDKSKTETIKKLEKKVNDLLKKQGQVTNDIIEVKKIKKQLIQGIVANMESDESDPRHDKLMSQSQRLIQEAKEKILSLEDESVDVPKQLEEANQQLAYETIRYCYDRLNTNSEDIELLEQWINETRIKLKKKLLIKQDKEAKNDQTYSYLHAVLGPDLMGVLDRLNEQ